MKLWCGRRDESPKRHERTIVSAPLSLLTIIPTAGMDLLVKEMKKKKNNRKWSPEIGPVTDEMLKVGQSGMILNSNNIISWQWYPGPPRTLEVVYTTGLTHTIQE